MNAVVRGDVHRIRIGRRSNIQDGTVVHVMNGTHPTTIGDDVTIGHAAIVHGVHVGDRVLIGMGAILLNGADIGEDSIVAAGTLLTEETPHPAAFAGHGQPGQGQASRSPTRKWRRSSNTPTLRRLPSRLHAAV